MLVCTISWFTQTEMKISKISRIQLPTTSEIADKSVRIMNTRNLRPTGRYRRVIGHYNVVDAYKKK